jgi:hypothetical protein
MLLLMKMGRMSIKVRNYESGQHHRLAGSLKRLAEVECYVT